MEDFLLVVVLIVLTIRWFVLSGRMQEMQRRIDVLEATIQQLRAERWAPVPPPLPVPEPVYSAPSPMPPPLPVLPPVEVPQPWVVPPPLPGPPPVAFAAAAADTGQETRATATETGQEAYRSEERRVGKECRSRWAP